MISPFVASSVRGFSESTAGLQSGQLISLPSFRGLRYIARDNASCWKYKRHVVPNDKEQNSRRRHRRYSWCCGGQCFDVTRDLESYAWYHLLIITSQNALIFILQCGAIVRPFGARQERSRANAVLCIRERTEGEKRQQQKRTTLGNQR